MAHVTCVKAILLEKCWGHESLDVRNNIRCMCNGNGEKKPVSTQDSIVL